MCVQRPLEETFSTFASVSSELHLYKMIHCENHLHFYDLQKQLHVPLGGSTPTLGTTDALALRCDFKNPTLVSAVQCGCQHR